jgi:DNA-binding MarR family transcriptional regulator
LKVEPRFDAVIHAPLRLQICGILSEIQQAEFGAVRDSLGVSDSVLSKHVRTLHEAGYVSVRKATVSSRVHTWISLTKAGKRAFAAHVAELQRLAGVSA